MYFIEQKCMNFSLRFHLSLFLGFELTIFHHWFRWLLGADQVTSHYLIQWWLVCWCIYVSLSLHELSQWNPKSQFGNWNRKWNSLHKPNLHWYMKPCFIMFGHPMVIIKSPQYTGGDFMFLYRFVRRRRRRRPQILVHAITFEQLFGFLSFLAQLLALTCRLPD